MFRPREFDVPLGCGDIVTCETTKINNHLRGVGSRVDYSAHQFGARRVKARSSEPRDPELNFHSCAYRPGWASYQCAVAYHYCVVPVYDSRLAVLLHRLNLSSTAKAPDAHWDWLATGFINIHAIWLSLLQLFASFTSYSLGVIVKHLLCWKYGVPWLL